MEMTNSQPPLPLPPHHEYYSPTFYPHHDFHATDVLFHVQLSFPVDSSSVACSTENHLPLLWLLLPHNYCVQGMLETINSLLHCFGAWIQQQHPLLLPSTDFVLDPSWPLTSCVHHSTVQLVITMERMIHSVLLHRFLSCDYYYSSVGHGELLEIGVQVIVDMLSSPHRRTWMLGQSCPLQPSFSSMFVCAVVCRWIERGSCGRRDNTTRASFVIDANEGVRALQLKIPLYTKNGSSIN